MNAERLLAHFDRVADAPDAVPRLRRFILDLAVRGRLVEQDPDDEPASELLKRIAAEMARLVKAGVIKKQKVLPGVTRDEQLVEPPKGWNWTRLGALTRITQGFTFSSGDFSKDPDDGPPLIKIGDIGTNAPEVFIKGKYDSGYIVNPGELLLGLSGSIKCAVWHGPPALLNQRIACIRPVTSDLIDAWLFLSVSACIDKWKDETSKLTVQNIKSKQMAEAPVLLPPLAEQHRIVAVVDELMALCDRLEAARAAREERRDRLAAAGLARLSAPDTDAATFRAHARFAIDNLPALTARADRIARLRQTILNLAVRGRLVEQDPADEPASELLKRIAAEKARLVKEGTIRKSSPPVPIFSAEQPFEVPNSWKWTWATYSAYGISDLGKKIKTKDVLKDGLFPVVDQGKILVRGYCNDSQKAIRVSKPLIIFGDHTRETKLIDFDFVVGADGIKILQPVIIDPRYYYLALQWLPLDNRGYGRHFKLLRSSCIPLPPLAEQHRIVAKVDELMALCDRLEAGLAAADAARRRLLDSLLHQALDEAA